MRDAETPGGIAVALTEVRCADRSARDTSTGRPSIPATGEPADGL
jgi:hypothetical protein